MGPPRSASGYARLRCAVACFEDNEEKQISPPQVQAKQVMYVKTIKRDHRRRNIYNPSCTMAQGAG